MGRPYSQLTRPRVSRRSWKSRLHEAVDRCKLHVAAKDGQECRAYSRSATSLHFEPNITNERTSWSDRRSLKDDRVAAVDLMEGYKVSFLAKKIYRDLPQARERDGSEFLLCAGDFDTDIMRLEFVRN